MEEKVRNLSGERRLSKSSGDLLRLDFKTMSIKDLKTLADERNNPRAMNCLALRFFQGTGVQKDEGMAYEYFKKACGCSYPVALRNLGMFMIKSEMFKEQRERDIQSVKNNAIDLFGKAASHGDVDSIEYFLNNAVKEKSLEKLKEFYQKMISESNNREYIENKIVIALRRIMSKNTEGINHICNELLNDTNIDLNLFAKDFENKGEIKDSAKICRLAAGMGREGSFEELCNLFKKYNIQLTEEEYLILIERGDLKAKYNYACDLFFGSNLIKKNRKKATGIFKEMADQNANAAYMYSKISEKYPDLTEEENPQVASRQYLKKSADLGYYKAKYEYAQILQEEGSTIEADLYFSYAFSIARSKAKKDPKACYIYAIMLYTGTIIPTDKKEAFSYFKRASEMGGVLSTLYCACMLHIGDGITQDKEMSQNYINRIANCYDNLDTIYNYALLNKHKNQDFATMCLNIAAGMGHVPSSYHLIEENLNNVMRRTNSCPNILA